INLLKIAKGIIKSL
uniref:Eumenine mastoparan-AF n=1 Tax=Anterhynchium flavomarginatum micado TaxID=329991 RepID=MAST_ANTFM|nr:RecName: Full=Eumenine mastoparan-AF; Short=EMP-AF; AltName: Full=Af-113 [Anterhynchium flavomarginatum micado]